MNILMDHVTKRFGSTAVIDDVSLDFHSGRIYGFQGINGCGKTTLMRLIAGLLHPSAGKIMLDGVPLGGQNSFPESMGLLIENPAFLGSYSGYQNLKLLAEIRGKIQNQDVKNAILRVGLDPDDKKKYRKYSLGMKQRLGIACAVMEQPDLLILDEPFISLDEDGVETVFQIIQEEKARGALIIVACHDYDMLTKLTDEIFRITAGKITKHLVKTDGGKFVEESL